MSTNARTPGLQSYFRPYLADIAPYVGVERIEALAARYGLAPDAISKLDANENPYGPSPLVYEALASLQDAHRYPDPLAGELRDAVAAYAGVETEQVLLGAGADEMLEVLLRLFMAPGECTLDAPPTFNMYPVFTLQNGGRVISVPRGPSWELNLPEMLARIEGSVENENERVKLVWVCSPNNPTGNLASHEEVVALLETGAPVIVDEAYYEFSGRTHLPLLREYPNLMIARTFSKLAGLAGMRIGYVVADPAVIHEAKKIKQPYNVNIAAHVAALASLRDLPRLQHNVDLIVEERERMAALLREHGELDPYPSDANYLLCRTADNDGKRLRDDLSRRGVFVRYFAKPGLEGCVRISAGAPADTDRLMSALEAVRPARENARASS